MALTTSQILDLLDGVLEGRAAGDLYERYTEAAVNRFQGMSIDKLLEWREKYANKLAAETGVGVGAARHSLFEPMAQ